MTPADVGQLGLFGPVRLPASRDGADVDPVRDGFVCEPAPPTFQPEGATYEPAIDRERLLTLQQRVEGLADGRPRTLAEWCRLVGGSATGVAARLRQARKRRFEVTAERLDAGVWTYALRRCDR